MKQINIVLIFLFLCLVGCRTRNFPKEKLSQFPPNAVNASYTTKDQKVIFQFRNAVLSPVRINIHTNDTVIQEFLKEKNPVVVGSAKDTSFHILLPQSYDPGVTFSSALGDPSREVNLSNISLPVKENTPVSIIQGYNSSYSHNTDYSRYAIDFNIRENDTIFAATDGVVIGVIKDYKHGGPGREWKGYDNFITIFDPGSGLYTQYAHLVYKGSLVEVGDRVKQGDPVGLSGKTGFAGMAHLHFNTLIPLTGGDLISVPVNFIEGYRGKELRKN